MDNKFLMWERNSRDTIDVKRCYIDVAGDLASGVLLSQIIYWNLPSQETGKPKLKVKIDGELWLAKARDEWWDECRLTPKQIDRAMKILEDKKLIETRVKKFKEYTTPHIKLNIDVLDVMTEYASCKIALDDERKALTDDLYKQGLTVRQAKIKAQEELKNRYRILELEFEPKIEEVVKAHDSKEVAEGKSGIDEKVKAVLTKSKNRSLPKVKTGIHETSKPLTETTTENTTKTNNIDAIPCVCDEDKKTVKEIKQEIILSKDNEELEIKPDGNEILKQFNKKKEREKKEKETPVQLKEIKKDELDQVKTFVLEKYGEVAYRTWFSDASIIFTKDEIEIKANSDLAAQIIKRKYVETLETFLNKKIVVYSINKMA